MSKRGATHRGRYRPRLDQRIRTRRGQRNRRYDPRDGQLADFPLERLQHMVSVCRQKKAHATMGAAHYAKLRAEEDLGCEFYIYECPICGKWHLTTHPWMKE